MTKTSKLPQFILPRSNDIVFIFFFYLVLVLGTSFFRDGDPGRHITFGRYMLATGHAPTEDIFTYTTSGVYLPLYEWGSQIIFGMAYNILGLGGVVVVSAFLISATLTLSYQEFLRRNLPYLMAFALVLWLGILTMVHWAARPHLFSFLFIIIMVPWLARMSNGERISLWRFPAIMVIWVNIHGAGYILIFLLWAAYIAGNLWDSWQSRKTIWNPIIKRLVLSGILTLAATLVNPNGWRLWEFTLSYVGNSYLLQIAAETRSVNFHGFNSYPFLLTLMGTLLLISRSQQKRPMSDSLLMVGWMALGLYAYRNIPIYGLVTFPILAEHLRPFVSNISWLMRPSQIMEKFEKEHRGYLWSVIISIILVAMLASGIKIDHQRQGYHFNQHEFPVQALDWLEKNPQQGHMFNYFPWGGYMIYRIWPEHSMFIDGQMIYVESLVREYFQILNAEDGWNDTLQYYEIEWILVPNKARIVYELRHSTQWSLIYEDDIAVILRQQK
jgi:hypothetical protein